jgi:methylated-DNA-[protein]-cysteine S-methyltransferase
MNVYVSSFQTTFGPFSVAVCEDESIVATAFGDAAALEPYLGGCHVMRDIGKTRAAREQVWEYCAGRRREFDLPLAPRGTPFQQRVWTALGKIPFGATQSYGQIARQLGNVAASRAVGRANATNPICLIVPCHRVIGADGSLTGFAFGEPLKRQLLEHERKVAAVRAA